MQNTEQVLQQGLDAHQGGDFALAEENYQIILSSNPDQPETNHAMGLLMLHTGQFSAAADYFEKALQIRLQDKTLLRAYMDALILCERFDEALATIGSIRAGCLLPDGELDALEATILERTVERNLSSESWCDDERGNSNKDYPLADVQRQDVGSDYVELRSGEVELRSGEPTQEELGHLIQAYEAADFKTAEEVATKILEAAPSNELSWSVLAVMWTTSGRLAEALQASRRLVEISPEDARSHYNLGNALRSLEMLEEAATSYQRAVALNPEYAEAFNNLGIALQGLGRMSDAEASFAQSLSLNPHNIEAIYNLGGMKLELGHLADAETYYREAIALQPDLDCAHGNLGVTLKKVGRLQEASDSFKLAIALNPQYAEARFNLGLTLFDLGSLPEAAEMLDEAVKLKPNYTAAKAFSNHVRQHMCDFTVYDQLHEDALQLGISTEAISPFLGLSWSDNAEQQLMRAKKYSNETFGRVSYTPIEHRPTAGERLRIGYFSADFHDFPGMYLMAGMLEHHDREQFEVFAFSYGPEKDDPMRHRIVSAVDHFIDIRNMPTNSVIELCRTLEIDIALHRNGHTKEARTELFQQKVAPVQISYLGYPGTLGAEFIDYVVADSMVIPSSHRHYYSENVIYMPNSYQPNDDARQISAVECTRAENGLPNNAFVLCCFNQSYKISPREFTVWMRVMKAVDDSVLWLLSSNVWAERNLREQAAQSGIDPQRLIFAKRVPQAEHLARHRLADLFVDTFNYNAHTTASDALWAGLPLVTKAGEQFAARVASSLLYAVGMEDLVALDEEGYEKLILDLVTDRNQLQQLRSRLQKNILSYPLFDTERYTRQFETGLKLANQRYQEGNTAADIFVEQVGLGSDCRE